MQKRAPKARQTARQSAAQGTEVVGYLGPDTPQGPDTTTFGYSAAKKHFATNQFAFRNFRSHEAICEAVATREVTYGVVAIENSITGIVAETIRAIKDMGVHGGVHVRAEIAIPIGLYYLRRRGKHSTPARAVRSHETALAQSSRFVEELRRQGIIVEPRRSTAEAAQEAASDASVAAIASEEAEQQYGLQRIRPESVTDYPSSTTRFWVIGREMSPPGQRNKTAILVALRQQEKGALFRALGVFVARRDGNDCYRLRPDKSRPNLLLVYPVPIPGRFWEYNFFMEFTGYVEDPQMNEGLHAFVDSGLSLALPTVLGSYPDTTTQMVLP